MSDQVLKEILSELKNMNHRLDNLEGGQKKGFIKVDNLETKVDSLDTRVGGLETKMDRMEANQLKLETRIETDVVDKIRVLFDSHSLYRIKGTGYFLPCYKFLLGLPRGLRVDSIPISFATCCCHTGDP